MRPCARFWYPNEDLARRAFHLGLDEPRRKIELFNFLDETGKPISLAEGAMAYFPNAPTMLHGDGLCTLTTYHFIKPPDIAAKIELNAKSSAGLPVDYFVWKGPGIIKDGSFIPTEVPAGASKPIEVTVGAYQVASSTKNRASNLLRPSFRHSI